MPETYRQSLVNRMRLQFEEARREGVYFPLNRDGDYWIAFQDHDQNEGFKMFENARDALSAEKKLRNGGFTITGTGRRDANMKASQAPSGTFVRGVIDILKKAGVSEKTQDQVYQSFLQSLPEMSMRKHSIHRRNIAGFSEDGLRSFAKNGFHGAHQLARLRHAQDMQIALEAMQQSVDAWRQGTGELGEKPSGATLADTAKADALVGELGKRYQWIMNPTDTQIANMANAIGYVYYLGASPASAITNLTQVAQTVLPVLGAQHGWPKAMRVLGAAWRDAARTGGHLDRTLTNPDERRAFLVMQQRGDFSKTQSHTLAGLAEGNVLQTSPGWTKTMNAVSWMFHTAEVINREATGMAAFRLARSRGDDFNKAVAYAGDINAGTNFDYAAANRPRIMQNNTARIALQFKQYSVGMTWLFYRNLYQAMKGETPEVRAQARRTVTGILGMTALLAGTTGLPMYNGVKAAANAANLVLGDPDQPFDFDTEYHAWLAQHFGDEAANVIATGPTSELTGANIANRTSLSNLWFQDADQNLEGADAYHQLLESLAGPLGGITKNLYVGTQRIREGNVQRGIETMLPTSTKNVMKALRFAHDGANTLRGDPILPDISGPQEFAQLLGFTPTALAQQQQVNSSLVNFTQAVQDRRQTLLNAYVMSIHTGNPDDRSAAMDQIRTFNQQYPSIAISPKTVQASLRARARYSAKAVAGVAINPKLRAQAQQFAGISQ
ncbi:MAG TPA: PLxRFG domain-containing protein [Rhodanobacteraceae bacterium]|nr:PLxRFG domain-containing protein [Rhodanobacteraceae bacterium]